MGATTFPYKRFVCVAGMQLTFGLLLLLVGVILAVFNYLYYDQLFDQPRLTELEISYYWYSILYLGATSLSLLSAIMHIITAGLGLATSRTDVDHKKNGLKFGYISMNTVLAIFFTWPLIIFGIGSLIVATYDYGTDDNVWPTQRILMLAFWGALSLLGLIVTPLSIYASAMACCCSPIIDKHQAYKVQPNNDDYLNSYPSAKRSEPRYMTAERNQNHFDYPTNHSSSYRPPSRPPSRPGSQGPGSRF